MINRTYMVFLPQGPESTFPPLDIVVSVPGTKTAPVADSGVFYPGATVTAPPPGWVTANLNGFYYELRGRAVRLEHVVGESGFTPRTNLGFHIAIAPWTDGGSSLVSGYGGLLPSVILSNSLSAAGDNALGGAARTLADPSYGPVIRIGNDAALHPGDRITPLWVVSLGIAERKDDDYDNIGSP